MKDLVSEALLNVLAIGALLGARLDELYAQFGLTSNAFSILRILSAEPRGYSRGEIALRLVSRAPDVTRLITGLQGRALVRRARVPSDRRLSVTQITPEGLALVARLEPLLEEFWMQEATKLPPAEWKELSRLCERISKARPPSDVDDVL